MLDSNHLVRNREGFLFWFVVHHLSQGENGTVGMLTHSRTAGPWARLRA